MTRHAMTRSIPALTLALLLTSSLVAAEMKTDLTFTFGDDNVLRDPGETRENSPSAHFGQVTGTPLDTAFPSEVRSSAMLLSLMGSVKSGAAFMPEGGLIMSLDISGGSFRDVGSFVRLNYFFDTVALDKKVYLDLYPNNSDQLRLGYSTALAWGTADVFPRNFRSGPVPGVKLGYASPSLYGFVGAKTALVRSPSEDVLTNPGGNTNKFVEQAEYGGLAGAGVELFDMFWVEAGGGFFSKGNNPRVNVLGKPILAGGGNARLSWVHGEPIGEEVGLRYYFRDPLQHDVFGEAAYDQGWSFFVGLEGVMLMQTLEDIDHLKSTKNELSKGAGFTARARYKGLRLHLVSTLRDLTYILWNVPGMVTNQALPEDVDVAPEISAALSVDYHFHGLGLTPSLTGAVVLPATYKGQVPEGAFADEAAAGVRKAIIMGENAGDWSILPAGEDELPVFMVRAALKWTFADQFAAIGEVFYQRDNNIAQVFQDSRGHSVRRFDKPDILGFMLAARMAF
jgi:hypothetical protein